MASRCLLLPGVLALACSVDHRHLLGGAAGDAQGLGASASSSTGASSNTGASSSTGASDGGEQAAAGATPANGGSKTDGGAAGASPGPGTTGGSGTSPALPPLVNGCADLDTDSIGDCTVTLVKNPSFKSDVESWTAVDTAALAWDPRNALADKPSGCALLSATGATDIDGSALFSASQCVAVPANQIVIAYANALVDANTAASQSSQAELTVSFFDSAECAGQPTSQFTTPPSVANTWATIQAGSLSGPATSSASVALVGVKPFRADALSICFDNVMVKTKAPSP